MRALGLLLLLGCGAGNGTDDPGGSNPEAGGSNEVIETPDEAGEESGEASGEVPFFDGSNLTIIAADRGTSGESVSSLEPSAFLRWLPDDGAVHSPEELRNRLLADGNLVEDHDQGMFAFDVPEGVRIHVLVACKDRRELETIPSVKEGTPYVHVLWMDPPTQLVHGSLTTPDGEPFGGFVAQIGDRSTHIGVNGNFDIRLQVTELLHVDVPGWPRRTVPFPAEDESVNITFFEGSSVILHLLDANGEPPAARVRVDELMGDGLWQATVDPEGSVRLFGLAADTNLVVSVLEPEARLGTDARTYDAFELRLQEGQQKIERRTLLPDAPIEGRLTDQHGRSLAGVEIALAHPPEGELPMPTYFGHEHLVRARIKTDKDGTFRFNEVPGGVWLVGVARGAWNLRAPDASGLAPGALVVRTGDEPLELGLHRGLRLGGRVVSSKSVSRLRVEARPSAFAGARETYCTQGGQFEFNGLMPGLHDLYIDDRLVRSDVEGGDLNVVLELD